MTQHARRRTTTRLLAALATTAVLAAACGGSDNAEDDGADETAVEASDSSAVEPAETDADVTEPEPVGTDQTPTTVTVTEPPAEPAGELTPFKVALVPVLTVAPLFVGINEGFFAEEGLDVQPQNVQGGQAVIAAALSGDVDLGFAAMQPAVLAVGSDVPVQAVVPGNVAASTVEAETNALMVSAGSDIQSLEDLPGKTVSTNAINALLHLLLQQQMVNAGLDPDSVNVVEIPFPEAPAALEQGTVDAVLVPEPFISILGTQGGRIVAPLSVGVSNGQTDSTYIAPVSALERDPELYRAFARAYTKAIEFIIDNPDAARATLTQFTELPEAIIEIVTLPEFQPEFNPESAEFWGNLMVERGLLDESPTAEQVIWAG